MHARVYADTSYLVSLLVQDAHSEVATAFAPGLLPLPLTPLGGHELRNAIRLCVFRRQITPAQRARALQQLEEDCARGVFQRAPLDWEPLVQHADFLARGSTERIGSRGMDILHVAAALALRARCFVTFDERQRELALVAGLDAPALAGPAR